MANDDKHVKIFEVGPRDGLQNEKTVISAADKIQFVELLVEAGLNRIEVTSFVRPGLIPQLSDATEVYGGVKKAEGVTYAALIPNGKGMENALKAQVTEAAVFTAASETFSRKNTNCSIDEGLTRAADVFKMASEAGLPVRGYVSTIIECPYEGPIAPEKTLDVCKRLLDLGVYEISLGETIGVAVPEDVSRLLDVLRRDIPAEKLAGHFHDTRGTALANVYRALDYGIRSFDASAGGLGGCPYAPGAAGNLATEDLVYSLSRSGYETGVDTQKLLKSIKHIYRSLGRSPASRVYLSLVPSDG